MNTISRLVPAFGLLATLLLAPAVQALQFTRLTTGPEAPDRPAVVRDGTTLYALAGHRLYRSSDGTQWTLLAGQPPAAANGLAAAGGRLYVLSNRAVFASGDGGSSWTDITGTLRNFQTGIFATASAVFVVTAGNDSTVNGTQFTYRLFRGDGQSEAWTEVFRSTDSIDAPFQAGANLCFANGNGGIRFSSNGGTTWTSASNANGNLGVLAVSADGATVLASSGTNSLDIRRSLNGCASFSTLVQAPAPNSASLSALGVDPSGAYYAGFADGSILRSGGDASFVADNSGDLPARSQLGVFGFTAFGNAILAQTTGGLFHNGSGTWTPASRGIAESFNAGLVPRGTGDALGAGAAGYWVSDAPATSAFVARATGLSLRRMNSLLRQGDTLLAGTNGVIDFRATPVTGENGLFRSVDDGLSWTQVGGGSGLPDGATVQQLVADGDQLYAAVSGAAESARRGVYRSTDAGLTWSALPGMANTSVRNLATRPGELYAYVGGQGVFKSTDAGANFRAVNNGLATNSRLGKVFAYSAGLIASAGGIVHRSTDGGETWAPTTGFAISRFGIELLALAEDAAGVLYLGDEHAGLSVSTDGGATWTPDSDGLTEAEVCIPRIQNLLVRNGKLYLGSGGTGVYQSNLLGTATPGDRVGCTTTVDSFPNSFSFTPQNNVAPSTPVLSNVIAINGLGAGVQVPIRVVGGEYSTASTSTAAGSCTGPFSSAPGTVQNGSLVCLRQLSAASGETARQTTLFVGDPQTMGEVSAVFTTATGLVFTGREDEINTHFGNNGFATPTATGLGNAADIAVLADGRVAAASSASGSNGFSDADFAMTLFDASGRPVSGFGTNGTVKVQLGGNDTVTAIVPLPGGKFVLAGYSLDDNDTPFNGSDDFSRFALVRLNADGSLDATFGNGGIVLFDVHAARTPPVSRFELLGDAVLLADGAILTVGSVLTDSSGPQFLAVKFRADGSVDPDFGGNDPQFADGVASSGGIGTSSIVAGAVAVQSTGRFVIAGQIQPNFNSQAGVVVRFNADGSFDTSFGSNGVRTIPTAHGLVDVNVTAGDALVVAGRALIDRSLRPLVARLNADGTLDTRFAGDGVFSLDAVSGGFTAVEVMADGDIAAIGAGTAPEGGSQLLHLRLTAAGVPASDFGPEGRGYVFRGPVNGTNVSGGVAAQRADGGLVVGGQFGSALGVFVFGGEAPGAAGDVTPDAFAFADRDDVEPMDSVVSAAATITGIDAPATLTVQGGEYSIGCSPVFVSTPGTISNGQSLCLRHTASAAFGGSVTTEVVVGTVLASFTSTTRAGNTAPTPFQFVEARDVAAGGIVISNAVVISGNEVAAPVSVSNGEYAIGCSQTFTAAPGSIAAGQSICVRHTAAATPATATRTVLTIGGVSGSFTSTTAAATPADTTPDVFRFEDAADVATGSLVVSGPVTVSGIDAPAAITVNGGEYSLDGGAFTAAAGTVAAGSAVRVRHTAAATPGTATNTVLDIGGVSDTFTSTTLAQGPSDTTPEPFQFSDRSGVVPNSLVLSDPVTVSGIDAPTAISISGGSYRIGEGALTTTAGTVRAGDQVRVAVRAGAAGTTAAATLTIGGVTGRFSVTAAPQSGGGSVNDPQGRPVHLQATLGAIANLQRVLQPVAAPTTGVQYPHGFFAYNVTGLPAGGTVQVSFTLPTAGVNAYVKCTRGVCARVPDAQVRINGRTLTLSMVDGGPLDEDGVANGVIVDPGAPAIITDTVAVESGGGALGGLLLLPLLGLGLLRRHGLRAAALAGITLVASGPALAGDDGLYLGLRAGPASSSLDDRALTRALQARGHAVTARVDERASGGTLYAGWRFDPAAALELGYTRAGEYRTSVVGTPVSPTRLAGDVADLLRGSGHGLSLNLRLDLALAGSLRFTPRLGAYLWDSQAELRVNGLRSRAEDQGLGLLLGLGLTQRLFERFDLGLGYQLLRPSGDHSLRALELQFEYRWGG